MATAMTNAQMVATCRGYIFYEQCGHSFLQPPVGPSRFPFPLPHHCHPVIYPRPLPGVYFSTCDMALCFECILEPLSAAAKKAREAYYPALRDLNRRHWDTDEQETAEVVRVAKLLVVCLEAEMALMQKRQELKDEGCVFEGWSKRRYTEELATAELDAVMMHMQSTVQSNTAAQSHAMESNVVELMPARREEGRLGFDV